MCRLLDGHWTSVKPFYEVIFLDFPPNCTQNSPAPPRSLSDLVPSPASVPTRHYSTYLLFFSYYPSFCRELDSVSRVYGSGCSLNSTDRCDARMAGNGVPGPRLPVPVCSRNNGSTAAGLWPGRKEIIQHGHRHSAWHTLSRRRTGATKNSQTAL